MPHTPGPWTVVNESSGGPRGDVSFSHQLIAGDLWLAAIASGDYEKPQVEQERERIEANLALIAAAPDLLEALRTTAGNIRSLGPAGALPEPYREWLRVVDEAIAKAEGK